MTKKQKITTILAMIMLLITLNGANSEETSVPNEWGTHGLDRYNSFDQTKGSAYTGSYTNFTNVFGSDFGGIIWDLNGDNKNEIALLDSGTLRLLNQSFESIATIGTTGINNIEFQKNGCTSNREALIILSINTIKKYAYDGSTLSQCATLSLSPSAQTKSGIKCYNNNCYFPTTTGFSKINITSNGFGAQTNYIDNGIKNFTAHANGYAYAPAISDMDSDGDDDIALYCLTINGLHGVTLYDNLGNQIWTCREVTGNQSANSAFNDDMRYPIITDTNRVFVGGAETGLKLGAWTLYSLTGAVVGSHTFASVKQPSGANDRSTGELYFIDDDIGQTGNVYVTRTTSTLGSATRIPMVTPSTQTAIILTDSMRSGTFREYASFHGIHSISGSTDTKLIDTTNTCTTPMQTYAIDFNNDGFLDKINSCSGKTAAWITQGTPITPPVSTDPNPTISIFLSNATKQLTESPFGQPVVTFGNIISRTGAIIKYTLTPDTTEPDVTTCALSTFHNDSLETPFTNINEILLLPGVLDTVGCNTTTPYTVTYSTVTEDTAHKYKLYRYDEDHKTSFDGLTFRGNPIEGYVILTNTTSTGILTVEVKDASTNLGISNAKVNVNTYYRAGSERVTRYTPDGLSSVNFLLPQIDQKVNVEADGYQTSINFSCTPTFSCIAQLTKIATTHANRVQIKDFDTTLPISGANVTIEADFGSFSATQTTDVNGITPSVTLDEGDYWFRAVANGYVTETDLTSVEANFTKIMFLTPSPIGAESALIITVKDSETAKTLSLALVTADEFITGYFGQEFTDNEGNAYFTGVPASSEIKLNINLENYNPLEISVSSGSSGTTQTQSVFLTKTDLSTAPNTIVVDGKTFKTRCDGRFVSKATEISCATDGDCPTGECGVNNYCSAFNYSWCDATGRLRDDACVAKATAECGLDGASNWMLSNFLWVIVIVIFLVALAFLASAFRK